MAKGLPWLLWAYCPLLAAAATSGPPAQPPDMHHAASALFRVQVLYLPVLVSEGEPLYVHLACSPEEVQEVEADGKPARFSTSEREGGGTELVVRDIRGSALSIGFYDGRIKIVMVPDLSAAAAVELAQSGLLRSGRSFMVLRHRPRVVKESRRWYVVRHIAEKMEGRSLPDKVLFVRPKGSLDVVAEGVKEKAGRFSEVAGLAGRHAPLLGFVLSLAASHERLEKAGGDAGIVLVLPSGEWDGGLAPETYRRVIEWLLDSLVAMGVERVAVVGPVGFGPAPERARAYRSEAASAAWSRKAFYVETDGVLEEEDFREGEAGPYVAEPCKDGQGRLLRAVLEGLKAARTIRPEEAE